MVCLRLNAILIVTVVATQARDSAKPRPQGLGPSNLGLVIPHLSGWGWNPTTAPPETTTGWQVEETTTSAPETTTGWPVETPTAAPGWPAPGWPAPAPASGWQAPGWGNPPGWAAAPAGVPVEIEMVGESAVVGEGESGATHGSQTSVSGDSSNPAIVQISSGSYSSLGQGSGILQNSAVSPTGEGTTFQGVDGYNFGDAGEYFGGTLQGNQVDTVSGGGSFTLGQGGIGQGGYTSNSATPNAGWSGRRK